jgi:hypothetical protein
MRIRIAVPEEHVDPPVIDAALEAVTRLDESLIRSGKSPTSDQLVASGAIWRPENMGDEHFDHGGTIAARGWGDCDDWAPLHAATLRTSGQDPGAIARVIPSGPSTYHAVVQRTGGHIELGPEDISARAGMRPLAAPRAVVGAGGEQGIEMAACDPHDGRVYYGQLLPTVGPLSLHCGPQFSVRGCRVRGVAVYEGRCDLPIAGSPMVGARGQRRHPRRRVRGGVMPYALSSTACGRTPVGALSHAIVGAILTGDAAAMSTPLDRYKLLALQGKLGGLSANDCARGLSEHIASDVLHEAARSGVDPHHHFSALASQLAAEGKPPRDVHPQSIAAAIVSAAGDVRLQHVVGMR